MKRMLSWLSFWNYKLFSNFGDAKLIILSLNWYRIAGIIKNFFQLRHSLYQINHCFVYHSSKWDDHLSAEQKYKTHCCQNLNDKLILCPCSKSPHNDMLRTVWLNLQTLFHTIECVSQTNIEKIKRKRKKRTTLFCVNASVKS